MSDLLSIKRCPDCGNDFGTADHIRTCVVKALKPAPQVVTEADHIRLHALGVKWEDYT